MFGKLMFLVVAATILGSSLLALRQQRYEIANEMIATHRTIDATRRSIWGLQAASANRVESSAIETAVAKANLDLEPVVPLDRPDPVVPAKRNALAAGSARERSLPSR